MKGSRVLEMLKGLVQKVQSLSRTQALIAATAAVVAVGGAGTGGYFVYENSQRQQETIADALPEMEETETVEVETEEEEIIAEVIVVTEETEAAEAEQRELSLVGTSMEKDLKVKIQDQNSSLVTGAAFVISVVEDKAGAKATTYEDQDKDGIIYINSIAAGNYKVVLEEIEGYTIRNGAITVTVKDRLEYRRVDVSGEIKTEREVNTAVEDTAVNNVPVESTVTDTLPLLESTVTTTKVDRSQVDTSNFTRAAASSSMQTVELFKSGTTVVEPKPGVPDTETEKPEPDTGTEKPEPDTGSEKPEPDTGTEKPEPDTGTEQPKTDTETGKPEPDTTEQESTQTETPDSSESGSEVKSLGVEVSGRAFVATASVERKRTIRVTAAADTAAATVSLPARITLYNAGTAESTSYTVTPDISGDASVIKKIEWSGNSANSEFSVTAGSNYSATIAYTGSELGAENFVATITYETDENGKTAEATITIVAEVVNMTDSTTVLKDKSGNTLYLDEKAKTQATLKDYASATVFYTAPQYTGWQTLDGKVYYYDANHNAVTGTQVIGGVTYTFAADGSLSQSTGARGIDVSKWQGKIDWGAVAASGINFAIIRVGYRGASTGALIEDSYFKTNIAGATRAGIKVGVYFFTQAITEAEAVEEASMVLSLIGGYRVTYPVFIDTESATNGRANGLSRSARTAVVRAFCQTIANGGHKPGVYASKSWYNNQLNASSLSGYCIWVAQYNSSCTYSGKYDIWQHTSKGSVPGIKGDVDMNISYMGY